MFSRCPSILNALITLLIVCKVTNKRAQKRMNKLFSFILSSVSSLRMS